MKTRTLGLYLFLLLAMVGCGGGGGGSTVGGQQGLVLTGNASKGPISGGTVKVFEVISSATTNPRSGIPRIGSTALVEGTTSADGSYSITLPVGLASASVMVQITGGSYKDEATGATRNVADQFGATGLRALVGNVKSGGQLSASVTPFTELAVQDAGPNPTDSAISASNGKIAAAFSLPDITATKPLDPNSPFPASGSDDAKKYALALATLSQYQNDVGAGASLAQIGTALLGEISAGGLTPVTVAAIAASTNNYAGGAQNPNPELNTPEANPSTPAAISLVTPVSPVSPVVGDPVTITVDVTKADQTNVPDGTLVNFATNLGTLSAASQGTVGGIASVTLTSATAGSATVTATSGSKSVASPLIGYIAQPTQAIVKVRTSGTLPDGTLIGGVDAVLTYTGGLGLSILPANVVASGVAATGVLLERNTNVSGQVVLGLITTSGIGLGEFATLTFAIAPGNFPKSADFSITSSSAIDTTTGNLTGLSAVIAEVTIQ